MNANLSAKRALLIASLFWSFGALSQTRLVPVDQAALVPDFFSFRANLQVAVARHDVEAVFFALRKDVRLSLGPDEGLENFKDIWRPYAADSNLWETLASVLSLGGTFAPDGTFTAPYVFTQWPQSKDAFDHRAVIGAGVRVRNSASASAPVIGSLDFTVVELAEAPAADAKWVAIKLSADRTGYVDRRFLRSPTDYRISFAKLEGRWQIIFFLEGD